MDRFTANAMEDIEANRLLCLTSISDPSDQINVRHAMPGEVADMVSHRDASEGDRMEITLTGSPTWRVVAGEDLHAGALVATGDRGKVVMRTANHPRLIGFTAHAANEGDVVIIVRQLVINKDWIDHVNAELQVSDGDAGNDTETEVATQSNNYSLQDKSVTQLKEIADDKGIDYAGNIKKDDLITKIEEAD